LCSFWAPLKANTVRIAVKTSSAIAPAFAYDFNSFVVITDVNLKNILKNIIYFIKQNRK
jgi:hypothetical protein